MKNMNGDRTLRCCIVGLGRFGTFWLNLLYQSRNALLAQGNALHPLKAENLEHLEFLLYDEQLNASAMQKKIEKLYTADENKPSFLSFSHIQKTELRRADIAFFCIPISTLKSAAAELVPLFSDTCILLDSCSVKENPVKWIEKARKNTQLFLATHPLFGPDSFADPGNRKIALCPVKMPQALFLAWSKFFSHLGMQPIQLSPEEHDMQVVFTQGLTHLVGRILTQLPLDKHAVTTKGFQSLKEIISQTCNDTFELFLDLQVLNPYSDTMWSFFSSASKKILNQLEERRKNLTRQEPQ